MVETTIYLILFLLPFGYFLGPWGDSKGRLSNILLGFYVYPLILLTMLSAEDYSLPNFSISLQTANLLRAGIHCVVALCFMRTVSKSRMRFRAVPGAILALVAITLMLLSTMCAGSHQDAFLRVVLLLVLFLNIFILIPTIARADQETYYRELTRGSIFLGFYLAGLSMIIFALQGNYAEWAVRLGRPLNPNALAFLLVFAFVSAAFVRRNFIVIVGLLIAIIATGSRLALTFAVVWLLLQGIWRASAWRRAGLVSFAFLSIGFFYWAQNDGIAWSGDGIFERSDMWAGRTQLWLEAVDSIQTSPIWGRGDRTLVETTDLDESMRAHNMLLENSISYGIPASLVAFAVYLGMGFITYRAWRQRDVLPEVLSYTPMWLCLLAFQLATTFVETSVWTNLGDGGNILFFLFVGPGLASSKAVLIARKKVQSQRLTAVRSASPKLSLNRSSLG